MDRGGDSVHSSRAVCGILPDEKTIAVQAVFFGGRMCGYFCRNILYSLSYGRNTLCYGSTGAAAVYRRLRCMGCDNLYIVFLSAGGHSPCARVCHSGGGRHVVRVAGMCGIQLYRHRSRLNYGICHRQIDRLQGSLLDSRQRGLG